MEILKTLEKSFAKAEAKVKATKGDIGAMRQFVVLGIFILIGVIVYANVYSSSPRSNLDAQANATLTNLNTTWYNSVNLLIIVFLVIAAVVILAYVGRIGGGGQ